MVSYSSHRFSSLFCILHSMFSSKWIISKDLPSTSQIVSSDWSFLLLILSTPCFYSFTVFFSSRILFGSYYYFYHHVKLFILFIYCFTVLLLSWFHWLVFLCFLVAHWASLEQLFWILYLVSHRSPYLWVTGRVFYSFGAVMFPWFLMFP